MSHLRVILFIFLATFGFFSLNNAYAGGKKVLLELLDISSDPKGPIAAFQDHVRKSRVSFASKDGANMTTLRPYSIPYGADEATGLVQQLYRKKGQVTRTAFLIPYRRELKAHSYMIQEQTALPPAVKGLTEAFSVKRLYKNPYDPKAPDITFWDDISVKEIDGKTFRTVYSTRVETDNSSLMVDTSSGLHPNPKEVHLRYLKADAPLREHTLDLTGQIQGEIVQVQINPTGNRLFVTTSDGSELFFSVEDDPKNLEKLKVTKVSPDKPARKLSESEFQKLLADVEVLPAAIDGGSSTANRGLKVAPPPNAAR